jgi:hypothetical protein
VATKILEDRIMSPPGRKVLDGKWFGRYKGNLPVME